MGKERKRICSSTKKLICFSIPLCMIPPSPSADTYASTENVSFLPLYTHTAYVQSWFSLDVFIGPYTLWIYLDKLSMPVCLL